MKCFRFLLVVASVCSFSYSRAQIAAYINGKEVKTGTTVSKKDLPSLEVGFKNPKSPDVISGKSVFLVQVNDMKNREIEEWYILKDGYVAFNDFLKNTPVKKKFKVFGSEDFRQNGNDLDWIFTSSPGQEDRKTVQVKISLFFRQETGYREYGQAVNLLEPVVLNMPMWDTKNLYLPHLDLTIDKTNIPGDFDSKQNGALGAKGTVLGYQFKDKNHSFYSIYALSNKDYPGMNAQELADDFIHAATIYANQGFVTKFKDYNIEKYTLPWDDINGLLTDRFRLPRLNWKQNKDIKGMDLMTLMQPVEINSMKGYSFKDNKQFKASRDSKWEDSEGKFMIYILAHPTNPDLTLIITTSIFGSDSKNADEIDAFLKTLINSIKH